MSNFRTTLGAIALISMSTGALADKAAEENRWHTRTGYEVTITNISALQFTPLLVVAHKPQITLFESGQPASDELALLAEGGDTGPLSELLATVPNLVGDFESTGGLLQPGESVTVELEAGRRFSRISVAAMLLPTNDSFVALNSARAPFYIGGEASYTAIGYDAGSEPNDELCANIPGPTCGGTGPSPDEGGEGYIRVSPGIHGEGDLSAREYDWRNPVARVTVRRVRR